MSTSGAHLDFAALKGRHIQRLSVLALDEDGVLEFRKGDIELLLDDASELVVTFDYDCGLVLRSGKATTHPYDTLSDWFDLRKAGGVIVRAELPESDLRNALYGAPIEEVSIGNDPSLQDTPILVRVVTNRILVLIGVEDTICTINFELRS